jgi:hypothetical protein
MAQRKRTATAYHEAGHAVIGRVLTLACGGATTKPDYRERTSGFAITADPYDCIYQWEKRGKWRTPNIVWIARIMTFMAGAEAEVELLGHHEPQLDSEDRREIAYMMEEAGPVSEERLRRMTRALVRRHKARIERVAKTLLAMTSLSSEALDKIVGRSVDDVKPNSPLLIAMHLSGDRTRC